MTCPSGPPDLLLLYCNRAAGQHSPRGSAQAHGLAPPGHHGAGRKKDTALADLGMSVRRSRWSWSVPVAFKHLSTFISGSRKIISEHQCLTGLGEGEGRSFGFVLFDQPTGQKQGEGKWTERLEFTLDRSHRTQSQQAGEADRNCHTRCSHIPLKPNKERRKGKIVAGGGGGGTKKCRSSNQTHTYRENRPAPGSTQPSPITPQHQHL